MAALAIFAAGLALFARDLRAEPHFVDESAYISQGFYGDLYLDGQWDHPAWLDYAGYDLPPLPKYLIGGALRLGGHRRPTRADARSWYEDTSRRFVGPDALVAARGPMVLLGAVGCVAMFGVGALAAGGRVGVVAALLLMANPLYRLHARRAMSDVPAECFILLALLFGLVAWRSAATGRPTPRAWASALLAGVMVGLATLSKLNGVLGGLILGTWALLGVVLPGVGGRSRAFFVATSLLAGVTAFGTFVALDPFLTARPPGLAPTAPGFWGRVRVIYDHRAGVSERAMRSFPHNALPTFADRLAVVAVQGFGRFGPLGPPGMRDSTVQFDRQQDWSAAIWLPVVLAGLGVALRRGRALLRAGRPPLPWLPALGFGVASVVVAGFIPLAWDRYLLSIQAPATLLGAVALVAAWDRLRSAWGARPTSQQGGPTP